MIYRNNSESEDGYEGETISELGGFIYTQIKITPCNTDSLNFPLHWTCIYLDSCLHLDQMPSLLGIAAAALVSYRLEQHLHLDNASSQKLQFILYPPLPHPPPPTRAFSSFTRSRSTALFGGAVVIRGSLALSRRRRCRRIGCAFRVPFTSTLQLSPSRGFKPNSYG